MSKQKSKNATKKKTRQFRYHKVYVLRKSGKRKPIWHPAYIFIIRGNVYRYVTITHSKTITGEEVIELRVNPNPKDRRKSYRVVGYHEDTKDRFGQIHKDWRINEQDDTDIRNDKKRWFRQSRILDLSTHSGWLRFKSSYLFNKIAIQISRKKSSEPIQLGVTIDVIKTNSNIMFKKKWLSIPTNNLTCEPS